MVITDTPSYQVVMSEIKNLASSIGYTGGVLGKILMPIPNVNQAHSIIFNFLFVANVAKYPPMMLIDHHIFSKIP